jgi:hypothetical protein
VGALGLSCQYHSSPTSRFFFAMRRCEGKETYIFSEQVRLPIVVHIQTRIPTLETKRLFTAQVPVLSTHSIARRDTNLGFLVIRTINVHPQHVLVRRFVEDDLWSFDNAIGTCVAGVGARQECAFVGPFYEVGGGVAVYVCEGCAVCFVFSNPAETLVRAMIMMGKEVSRRLRRTSTTCHRL